MLAVGVPTNGRITGAGLDCGGGNFVCHAFPPGGTRLTITAVADPGYVFMGWSDDCRGNSTATVHVNGPKICSARFEPLILKVQRSVAYWDRSLIGGSLEVYSPVSSRWSVTSFANGNHIRVLIDDAEGYQLVEFSAPRGQPLAVGYYGAAREFPFTAFNGLDVSSSGRVAATRPDGSWSWKSTSDRMGRSSTFAADFEHHCEDAAAGQFGAIRHDSFARRGRSIWRRVSVLSGFLDACRARARDRHEIELRRRRTRSVSGRCRRPRGSR